MAKEISASTMARIENLVANHNKALSNAELNISLSSSRIDAVNKSEKKHSYAANKMAKR